MDPADLGRGLEVLVALAVGLILFEGGLTLDRGVLREAPVVITRLLTVGVFVTLLVGTLALVFLADRPWRPLLGASLGRGHRAHGHRASVEESPAQRETARHLALGRGCH